MPCLENCKIDKLKLAGLYQGLISTEDKCLSRQNCKIEIGVFGSRLDVHSRQTNMWIISVVLNWTSALGGFAVGCYKQTNIKTEEEVVAFGKVI